MQVAHVPEMTLASTCDFANNAVRKLSQVNKVNVPEKSIPRKSQHPGKVNIPEAIDFKALCGKKKVTWETSLLTTYWFEFT